MKNIITIPIILLFISLSFIPVINANLSISSDSVKITTYFNGVNGLQAYTVNITKEESIQLDILFDEINQKLKNSKSMEEAEFIIKDAIKKLDKLKLIPKEIGIKKAQVIATGKILSSDKKNRILFNRLKRIEGKKDSYDNKFCYIAGESTEEFPATWFHSLRFRTAYTIAILLYTYGLKFNNEGAKQTALGWMIVLGLIFGIRLFKIGFPPYSGGYDPFYQWPFMMGGWINYGVEVFPGGFAPSEGWVTTYGTQGLKEWTGDLWGHLYSFRDFPFIWDIGVISHPGVSGFFGIMFEYSDNDPIVVYPRKYVGFSIRVKIGHNPLDPI